MYRLFQILVLFTLLLGTTRGWAATPAELLLNGSTSGTTALEASPSAGGTVLLPAPATTDTLVDLNDLQTLKNKTVDCSVNICLNVPVVLNSAQFDNFLGPAEGKMLIRGPSSWQALSIPSVAGTYELQVNGPGTTPQWVLITAAACGALQADFSLNTGCNVVLPMLNHL